MFALFDRLLEVAEITEVTEGPSEQNLTYESPSMLSPVACCLENHLPLLTLCFGDLQYLLPTSRWVSKSFWFDFEIELPCFSDLFSSLETLIRGRGLR